MTVMFVPRSAHSSRTVGSLPCGPRCRACLRTSRRVARMFGFFLDSSPSSPFAAIEGCLTIYYKVIRTVVRIISQAAEYVSGAAVSIDQVAGRHGYGFV